MVRTGALRYHPAVIQNHRVDAVDREIAEEKAAAFGRAARALVDALTALERFDAGQAAATEARATLVDRAAERVLHVLAQREACGLRDADYVFGFYGVPREVVQRVGAT